MSFVTPNIRHIFWEFWATISTKNKLVTRPLSWQTNWFLSQDGSLRRMSFWDSQTPPSVKMLEKLSVTCTNKYLIPSATLDLYKCQTRSTYGVLLLHLAWSCQFFLSNLDRFQKRDELFSTLEAEASQVYSIGKNEVPFGELLSKNSLPRYGFPDKYTLNLLNLLLIDIRS